MCFLRVELVEDLDGDVPCVGTPGMDILEWGTLRATASTAKVISHAREAVTAQWALGRAASTPAHATCEGACSTSRGMSWRNASGRRKS